MKGVMIPAVSAGSSQVGASVMCTPTVSWPDGAAAFAGRAMPAAILDAARARTSRRVVVINAALSSRLQREIIVWRSVGVAGYPAKVRFTDAWPDSIQECQLPQMCGNNTFVENLLHLGQYFGAPCMVEFHRLLLKQGIEIGIAA